MAKELNVWEEFPPSKYGCTIGDYIIHLMADLIDNQIYPDDIAEKKLREAVKWVQSQPEYFLR